MKVITYRLLYKPHGEFPCKRKYFHDVESDIQALEMANDYVKKKNGTIYLLEKRTEILEYLVSEV